jgi:hypothetical protein
MDSGFSLSLRFFAQLNQLPALTDAQAIYPPLSTTIYITPENFTRKYRPHPETLV